MIQLTKEQLEAVFSGDLTENEKSVLQYGNLYPEEWKRIFGKETIMNPSAASFDTTTYS